jgi:hypothetical protein
LVFTRNALFFATLIVINLFHLLEFGLDFLVVLIEFILVQLLNQLPGHRLSPTVLFGGIVFDFDVEIFFHLGLGFTLILAFYLNIKVFLFVFLFLSPPPSLSLSNCFSPYQCFPSDNSRQEEKAAAAQAATEQKRIRKALLDAELDLQKSNTSARNAKEKLLVRVQAPPSNLCSLAFISLP